MTRGKKILAFFHLFTLFISVILLFILYHDVDFSVWKCQNILLIPFLVLGFLLASLSIFGLVTLSSNKSLLLKIHLFGLFVLAISLYSYSDMSLSLTEPNFGEATFDEELDFYARDFSEHLRSFVVGSEWIKTITCLKKIGLCAMASNPSELPRQGHVDSRFQRGCCLPRRRPKYFAMVPNVNAPREVCKGAVLARMVTPWRAISKLGFRISLCLLVISGAILYAIWRNSKLSKPYPGGYAHEGGRPLLTSSE